MTKIKPLGSRVLVRRAKKAESKGGILLPDSAQETPREGEVLAIGPGRLNENGVVDTPAVEIGDSVLFAAYAGTEVKQGSDDEAQLLILNEDDILGVLTRTAS
jgi:chaperonin GroES